MTFKQTDNTYSTNFSDKQVFEIVKLAENQDYTWERIAEKLNKKWFTKHSPGVFYGIHRRFSQDVIKRFKGALKPHPHKDFTREALSDRLGAASKSKQRFIITAVGAGQKLHKKAFQALQTYCRANNATMILLPMRAQVRALDNQPNHYDPALKPYKKYFYTEYVMNSRIKALELQINPQQINPLTGISKIRGKAQKVLEDDLQIIKDMVANINKISLVVAHSKQMLEVLPTGNNTDPRVVHTTGAITMPSYLTNTRTGLIATEEHDLGAVVVEVEGNAFHIRQVQFNAKNGSLISLGKRYKADGKVEKESAEMFVMGDIHPGYECEVALKAWYQVWKEVTPKRIALHDWFDGTSVSHHLSNHNISKALRPPKFATLEAEILHAKKVLYEKIANHAPKNSSLYLIPSNHPDFLIKYLERGDYVKDPANFDLAHRMVVSVLDGKHYLKPWLDPDNRYKWLKRDDDLLIEGIQTNCHGDKAANGVKGSPVALERTYSDSMSGHTHTPRIFKGAWVVGHSSLARHGYNTGASSWVLCSGNIYKGGHRELIMIINGKYKI